jgi:hypothetical protein
MACQAYTAPLRANRRFFMLGLENHYGEEVETLSPFMVYDADLPVQAEFETFGSVEENVWMGGNSISTGGTRNFVGSVFLDGSGSPLTPPLWTHILQSAGWGRDEDIRLPYAVFTASNVPKSVSIGVSTARLFHLGLGARSTFVISGSFGQPVRFTFNSSGLYVPREERTFPASVTTPLIPPRYVQSQTSIITDTGVTITPIQKYFTIDSGMRLLARYEDNETGQPTEIFIEKPIATIWETTIEVNSNVDWIETILRQGVSCNITTTVGQETGRMVELSATQAQLISTPTYGNVDGVLTTTLQFGLKDLQFAFK